MHIKSKGQGSWGGGGGQMGAKKQGAGGGGGGGGGGGRCVQQCKGQEEGSLSWLAAFPTQTGPFFPPCYLVSPLGLHGSS